jgi:hypothetical protein
LGCFGNPSASGGLTNPANWGNELRLTNNSFNILNAANAGGWFLGDYEGLVSAGGNFEAFFSQAGSPFPQSSIFSRQILDGPGSTPASRSGSPGSPTSAAPAGNPDSGVSGPHTPVWPLPSGQSSDPSGFLTPVSYPVDKAPDAVAVGDFNNDGIPDLVISNAKSNDVSLLLGNGDGTFQPAQNIAVGKNPEGVAVGDFNGDGNLDIVTANGDGTITVLPGKGNGTFRPPETLMLPNVVANQFAQFPRARAIAVGDLNGDGKLDLVVSTFIFVSSTDKEYVDVFLGNGDGTFQDAIVTPTNGSFGGGIALADFNHDGKLDVVTSNENSLGRIPVLLGNGDGTFQETSDPNIGAFPETSVAVGDFNHDGNADLVVSGFSFFPFQNFVSVLLGQGNGTFQAPQKLSLSAESTAVAVADFNRDGNLDIVTAIASNNFPNPGAVSVFLGNGQGGFQSALNFSSGVVFASALAVGDFNRDGFPDLVMTDGSFNTATSNTVTVLINSGSWPALTITATTTAPALTTSAGPAALLTGSAPNANVSASSSATLTPSASASSQTANLSSAVLFWADPTADQLLDRMALWFGTPPAVDDWADPVLSDSFVDPFKR